MGGGQHEVGTFNHTLDIRFNERMFLGEFFKLLRSFHLYFYTTPGCYRNCNVGRLFDTYFTNMNLNNVAKKLKII